MSFLHLGDLQQLCCVIPLEFQDVIVKEQQIEDGIGDHQHLQNDGKVLNLVELIDPIVQIICLYAD